MDVRQMRQVLAIHRHGSFIRAAEELGIAQPTLSKSIARLEDVLGVKLFDRSGSGARVTPMGGLIVARAEKIVGEAERLGRDIELVAQGQMGEARIGLAPGLRSLLLPRFAEALATRYPSLKLAINVHSREQILADLQSGALDIALVARAPDLDAMDLVQTEIVKERLVALASPTHPLARLQSISLAAFLRHPAGARNLPLIPFASLPQDAEDLRRYEPRIVCNDDATLKQLALRGLITVLSIQQVVQPEIDAGQMVLLPLELDMWVSGVALMTRAASHSPILNEIVELAQSICADLKPLDHSGGETPAPILTPQGEASSPRR